MAVHAGNHVGRDFLHKFPALLYGAVTVGTCQLAPCVFGMAEENEIRHAIDPSPRDLAASWKGRELSHGRIVCGNRLVAKHAPVAIWQAGSRTGCRAGMAVSAIHPMLHVQQMVEGDRLRPDLPRKVFGRGLVERRLGGRRQTCDCRCYCQRRRSQLNVHFESIACDVRFGCGCRASPGPRSRY